MSYIGKKVIQIPTEISIIQNNHIIEIKGPLGSLIFNKDKYIYFEIKGNELKIHLLNLKYQAIWGTTRSIINNMIIGVSEGFKKRLKLEGIGYKVIKQNNELIFHLGYSHEIKYLIPKEVLIEVLSPTLIEIQGINKEIVGQVAAEIRNFRIPSNYRIKGIYYQDEKPRLKVTKNK